MATKKPFPQFHRLASDMHLEVIRLRDEEEKTFREIAVVIGKSSERARFLYQRGKACISELEYDRKHGTFNSLPRGVPDALEHFGITRWWDIPEFLKTRSQELLKRRNVGPTRLNMLISWLGLGDEFKLPRRTSKKCPCCGRVLYEK